MKDDQTRVVANNSPESLFRSLLTRRQAIVAGGGLLLASALASCGFGSTPPVTPKRGGNLNLGVAGSGIKDATDAMSGHVRVDQARTVTGWETLTNYDRNYNLSYDGLAESIERPAPDRYIIKLRSGIEFHNSKTLSADDVIYSIRRALDPKAGYNFRSSLLSIDPNQLQKLDPLTVQVGLNQPDSTLFYAFAQFNFVMVPDGYTGKGTSVAEGQVGTGPFMLQSFTPGNRSVHTRFANYWKSGLPHLDQVTMIDIDDDTSRTNALVAGQVDVIADLPFSLVPVVKGHADLTVFENPGGAFLPFNMLIDQEPFNDPRVRQAMRLIVDRPQMVQQALAGHGRVGNDMYGVFDAGYASELPQRTQDIAKAKSLLAAAGKSDLVIDLQTTPAAAGMVQAAEVFAVQAKAAGVTVNVRQLDGSTFYGPQWPGHWTFANDYWGYDSYLAQVQKTDLKGASSNETHWPPTTGQDSDFAALYKQAIAAPDSATTNRIVHEMMTEHYNDGGMIIPFFVNLVDAYSSKLTGFQPNRGHLNLDSFGRRFAEISFK